MGPQQWELRKHGLACCYLAVSGGTVGLTLSELGFRRLAIVAGIVVMVGLVVVGVVMHRGMRRIIGQLEEV